ncbi:MAG: M42 family metallopeptidase [Armatimonadota bacterium]|nr:MAG: M42 family metallopeptidase [Armatimonadota bacterium]
MRKESLEFFTSLVDTPSPSGFEQPSQTVVRQWLGRYAADVRTDVMGNVIGALNPSGSPRVMLAGHVDEIGLMIRYISDDGFLHFAPIGGVDPQLVPGQRVMVHSRRGPVLGVVGKKAIHLMDEADRKKVLQFHQQWIDIGAADRKAAEKRVAVGDPATVVVGLQRLDGDIVTGRAMDDKCGAFVVCEALRLLARRKIDAAVYAVSTVQEELGRRGAVTSAFGLEPEVGIAVDVDHATDFPEAEKKKIGDRKLGGGPVLHRGAHLNPVITELLFRVAEQSKIAYQINGNPRDTGTDATVMQLSRAGVATGLISVPLRYMHTPVEVISLADLENCAKLLAGFVAALEPGMSFIPH